MRSGTLLRARPECSNRVPAALTEGLEQLPLTSPPRAKEASSTARSEPWLHSRLRVAISRLRTERYRKLRRFDEAATAP